jgi:hypothetical protein
MANCNALLDAALRYAAKGKPVFPCRSNKQPYTSTGFKAATTDPEQIQQWWSTNPDAWVGMPTGAVSGIVVADLDRKNGVDGWDNFRDLQRNYHDDSDTQTAITPSGGYHFFYRHPGPEYRIKSTAGQIAPGVDIRGDGGYVIVPPSPGYEFEASTVSEPVAMPDWLLEKTRDRPLSESLSNRRSGPVSVGEGQRNTQLTSRGGLLRRQGFDEHAIVGALLAENDAQCRPPLPELEVRRIARSVARYEPAVGAQEVMLEDFYAHMPDHRYIFAPTRDLWPAASVDSRLPPVADGQSGKSIKPSKYLDQHRPVEQMVWAPGQPMVIEGRLVDAGGWVKRRGVSVFNLYRPPVSTEGNPNDIGMWRRHLERIYPGEAEHLINWFAHRVQYPGEKVNHGVVLGGAQGIGKDTLLEPLKVAVGPWNFNEVSPPALLGRFNSFVKSVVLRVSEARDLGDMDRFAFYDHMKTYLAAPPDVLRCDEKNIREHSVLNVCGVIITTNHKSDGIYLPTDDRRHFVAWSDADRSEFDEEYWRELWDWYGNGGIGNVCAYLRTLDLCGFNPKAPPPKTEAFWHIVNAGRSSESSEIADIIDRLQNPDALTLGQLSSKAASMGHHDFNDWLMDRRNRRTIPHRLEEVGYEPVRNDTAKDGMFKIQGKRQAVYARRELTPHDRLAAAQRLTGR